MNSATPGLKKCVNNSAQNLDDFEGPILKGKWETFYYDESYHLLDSCDQGMFYNIKKVLREVEWLTASKWQS